MKEILMITFIVFNLLCVGQEIESTTNLDVTLSWSQEPNGHTFPVDVYVPKINSPKDGHPVCVLLHGRGGNGVDMIRQFQDVLTCHVLIAPTGYKNSWNLCEEESDAPDVELIGQLVLDVQSFSNTNSSMIRVLGNSNGSGLANRILIENTNPGIDIICAIVSQLNVSQYHLEGFYAPSSTTDPSESYCGYNNEVDPLSGRRYLSICNENDPIIPYHGGSSVVGLDFLAAEEAAYLIAQQEGFSGSQLQGLGTPMDDPIIYEFNYLEGKVVHLKGTAQHSINESQKRYIAEFFGTCDDYVLKTDPLDSIKLYPNPTYSSVYLQQGFYGDVNSYSIIDAVGMELIQGKTNPDITEINLMTYPAGTYFLRYDEKIFKIIKIDR